MKILITMGFLIAFFLPPGAVAQTSGETATAVEPQVSPCESDPGFREFDFWVGDWEVHDSDGKFVGENSITREQNGCVLIENWRGAEGSTGMSINYLDRIGGEWVQIWHAAAGYQIDIRGGLTDAGMALNGKVHYIRSGQTAAFRGLWTPMPDGRVRQFFEQSNDGGKTWQTWFEGFYSRKSTD